MKTWLDATIEEVSFANTAEGQYPKLDFDGIYQDDNGKWHGVGSNS